MTKSRAPPASGSAHATSAAVFSRWLRPVLAYRFEGTPATVALSTLAVLGAAVLQLLLRHALGSGGSFVTFVPAILVVASLGGLRAAAATFLVSTVYAVLTMPPAFGHNVGGVLTFAICVGVAGFTAALLKEAVAEVLAEGEALRASEENSRIREALSPAMLWEADAAGRITSLSPALRALAPGYGESPPAGVHPDDRDAAQAAWDRARRTGEPFLLDHRIATPQGQRWYRARAFAHHDAAGQVDKWYGATEDVHDQRTAEEARALLMREVDHRARNALMVVQALVNLTRTDDVQSFAQAIQARIQALARSHSLLSQTRWSGVDLHQLLDSELAAYEGHVALLGPEVVLAPMAVQPIGLLIHEMAVNAAKHGALSSASGSVEVSWGAVGGALELVWSERGGPPLSGEPEGRGFGSRLIRATLAEHRGAVALDWAPEGLRARFTLHQAVASVAEPAKNAPAALKLTA